MGTRDAVRSVVENVPGICKLKPKQEECLLNILNGADVVALLPTGFGKSLIYQLFPIVSEKLGRPKAGKAIVVIVSPLVALMEDQVKEAAKLEWPEFVKNYAPWWASHTLDWLKYGKKVQVVHFEDLKRDLFSHLKSMVIFLGLEVSEDRLLCVEGQKDGNFKRSGLRKLDYDPYTPEMRATIDGLIKTVDTALRKRNMSGVPEEYMPR